uniref:Uncharacterized protein n=1 Tax=Wuchereria bancrofti TaxID=6293 RepID=A0AAF5Q2W3_WUCBA
MGPNLHNFDLLRGKIDASRSCPTRGACGSGRMLAD